MQELSRLEREREVLACCVRGRGTHVHDGGGAGLLRLPRALAVDLGLDGLPDGQLAGALADLRQVGAAEALRHLRTVSFSV